MSIVKPNAQGVIGPVTSLVRPGADGVLRTASSAWTADSSGVLRRVYDGGSQPSNRVYVYRLGVWSGSVLTSHSHVGDYAEGATSITLTTDNTAGPDFAMYNSLTLAEPTTAATSATLMQYTKIGIDLHSVSDNGSYATLTLINRSGMTASDYTARIPSGEYDNVMILDISGVTATVCAGGVRYTATAMQGYVQRTTIRAIWLA